MSAGWKTIHIQNKKSLTMNLLEEEEDLDNC